MDRDQLGLKQGVDLAAVESCHVKSSPQGVVLHQGQLDVPSVKDCTLFGQNVLGEYACDLKQGEMKEKIIVGAGFDLPLHR